VCTRLGSRVLTVEEKLRGKREALATARTRDHRVSPSKILLMVKFRFNIGFGLGV